MFQTGIFSIMQKQGIIYNGLYVGQPITAQLNLEKVLPFLKRNKCTFNIDGFLHARCVILHQSPEQDCLKMFSKLNQHRLRYKVNNNKKKRKVCASKKEAPLPGIQLLLDTSIN